MNDTLKKMISLAKDVSVHSYSPYSHFRVGCCIRTKRDQFFVGCNIENAAFPSGQCAEGSTIGSMISNGEDEIAEVVLYTYSKLTCWPCGNCRQMLSEFAKGSVLVHSISEHHELETLTLAELLPESFSAKTME